MTKKQLVFIINPHAGTDRNKALSKIIQQQLDTTQYEYELCYTQYAQHGIELAKEAAEKGAYGVIAVGGDGSLNDVIAGLRPYPTIVGIIPMGSGNGLARALHIPSDVRKAIHLINQNHTVTIDVATANEKVFVSNAGVGFDACITDAFKHSKKRGFLSYARIILQQIIPYQEKEYLLTIDGKTILVKAFMITVANGSHLGYNFVVAPHADCTDGQLQVIVIKKFPKLIAFLLALRMITRSLHKSSYVQCFSGKEIKISAPGLATMQTDGDAHATHDNEVHIRLCGKQKVWAPKLVLVAE